HSIQIAQIKRHGSAGFRRQSEILDVKLRPACALLRDAAVRIQILEFPAEVGHSTTRLCCRTRDRTLCPCRISCRTLRIHSSDAMACRIRDRTLLPAFVRRTPDTALQPRWSGPDLW